MPMQSESRFWADEGMGSISAVVASLPNGATLGEERIHAGVRYKLCYNAGNSQILPGNGAVPIAAPTSSVASVTVTSASQGGGLIGGVVVVHATATTGTYFWGAFKGLVPGVIADAAIASGTVIALSDAGSFQALVSAVTGKFACGMVVTTVSSGSRIGSAYVSFL